jgi:1-deoxy-D-xylulose-5-phosphate reductoisomerase
MEVALDKRVDTMISAINGTTSLEVTIESIRNNHRICFANKETLVVAGELINRELDNSNAELIPIDSEQSAIFQCIIPHKKEFIKNVILTASGGPFFERDKESFSSISIQDALSHPTWSMGTKITIDSATLMNKALEIIEAFYLFKLKKEQIDVIIHPQSIVHSMVEFIDSSIMAQLSVPDMRIPILYSLSYPERIESRIKCLSFSDIKRLEFFEKDIEKFSSIEMAYYALEKGKNAGAVLNAANEVAVESFLNGEIRFDEIFKVVEVNNIKRRIIR